MNDREKVINGLKCLAQKQAASPNPCRNCGYIRRVNFAFCVKDVAADALELLKEQEPRLITKDDFANADACGTIPAWIECHPKYEVEPVWNIIDIDMLSSPFAKAWTSKPTDEQRKAVKWE